MKILAKMLDGRLLASEAPAPAPQAASMAPVAGEVDLEGKPEARPHAPGLRRAPQGSVRLPRPLGPIPAQLAGA